MLIDEALENGASLIAACDILDISDRTYYRWKKLYVK
ncbi:MAG: helix-turn-helix domain-containing protein [Lachnospiraceae bacterium]|nr:helix-turn-helix domain-containing protein [Lachnospiraceae bacterium]